MLESHENSSRSMPTFEQFQARATNACTPGQKSAYAPVWRRACERLGSMPLDQVTTLDIRILQQADISRAAHRTNGTPASAPCGQ